MEHKGDGDTCLNWCTRNNPLRLRKKTGRFGNQVTSEEKLARSNNKKQKKTCQQVDFAVPVDQRAKTNGSETIRKY